MAWSGYILDLVAVAGFELGWAEVAEAAVQAGAVVPADVLVTARRAAARVGQACRSISSPLMEPKNQLSDRALSQHWPVRPWDSSTSSLRARAANSADVYWHPRSAWKITPGRGVAGGDRVGQRVGDQFGAQVIGHGVADDAAGGDVDDGSQVQPPLPGGDIGDVAAPPGVHRCGTRGEVAADPVAARRCRRVGDGGALPSFRRPALQAAMPSSAGRSACGRGDARRGPAAACTRGAP